jgi:hypothetical protein
VLKPETHMKTNSIGMLIAGAALIVVQAKADPNLLYNGSFEIVNTHTIPPTVAGWTGTIGVDIGTGVKAPGAEDGLNAAFFQNNNGSAEQTTTTPIQSGLSYDLTFWTMDIDTYNATWSGAAQGQISIEVYAGTDANPIFAQDNFNLGFSSDGATPGTWVLNDLAIPASAIPAGAIGQNIGIRIWNTSDQLNPVAGSWIYVDNMVLVPEPATAALLGFGALATVLGLRRRRA